MYGYIYMYVCFFPALILFYIYVYIYLTSIIYYFYIYIPSIYMY